MSSQYEHLLETRHRLACCLLGILVALATAVAALQTAVFSAKEQMRDKASLFQTNVLTVNTSRESIFEFVRSIETAACAPETLSRLREQLYLHYVVQDVVVFKADEHEIICTALAGVLPEPIVLIDSPQRNPKFPNRLIWNEPELAFQPGDNLHHIVKEDRYGIVVDTLVLRETFEGEDWQVFVRTADDRFAHSAFGQEQIYRSYEENLSSLGPKDTIFVKVCYNENHHLCMLLARPFLSVISDHSLTLLPSWILALVLGLLTYQYSIRFVENRRSIPGRILRNLKSYSGSAFSCHYQPIVDLENGEIIGCEALARFEDNIGPVSPMDFIPVIESFGLTWTFTELVFQRAIEDVGEMGDLSPDFRLAINVFPTDLGHKNLKRIRESVALRGLLSLKLQIVFEILETASTEFSTTVLAVQCLTRSGAEIAIDDFGTGFSNLEQLRSIDADCIKIDKTFIDEVAAGRGSVAGSFVKHIVALAADTQLKVVAEGIENVNQVERLRAFGVGFGQGYLFSRPLPIEGFAALLANRAVLWQPPTHGTDHQVASA